jgi:methylmalonyl-CoA carboxyltransferase small subunit
VKLNIKIDQKTYEVEVEAAEPDAPSQPPRGYVMESAPVRVPAAPLAAPPAPLAAPPAPSGSVNEEKVCRSPVSGNVVRVMAHAGQSIQVGDVLLVLEAMKMETNITAPVSGKLAAVKVNAGESVQSGQVVVEFE